MKNTIKLASFVCFLSVTSPAQSQDSPYQIGRIAGILNPDRVQICHRTAGGESCEPASRGKPLYSNQYVRTGDRARVRIMYIDRLGNDIGPDALNVGSNSTFAVAQDLVNPIDNSGLDGLIRVVLREFGRNWGPGSVYRVRLGVGLCGIRGTDTYLKSWDNGRRSEVGVRSGVVACMCATCPDRSETQIDAGMRVQLTAAGIGRPEPLPDGYFEDIVRQTSLPSDTGASFDGAWKCPERGTIRFSQSANNLSGSFSGSGKEHWASVGRQGGTISGTVEGNRASIRMINGDGSHTLSEISISASGREFSGDYSWYRGANLLGSGQWSCQR